MKKLIFSMLFVLIGLATFAQLGGYLTVKKANSLYPQIDQGFQLKDTFYTETESRALFYTKKQVQSLPIQDELVSGLQSYGSTIKALPYGIALPHLFASNSTMVDGTLWDIYVQIKDTVTITGVGYVQHTQGAYTADQYNGFAIYSTSGGTDTKVVETPNDGNLWKAAAGNVTKAFTTPQVLLPGNYKICAVWNASATTTAPVVYTHTGVSANITYLLPNSQKITGTVTSQNTMPSTIANSSLTSQSTSLGIYLY